MIESIWKALGGLCLEKQLSELYLKLKLLLAVTLVFSSDKIDLKAIDEY